MVLGEVWAPLATVSHDQKSLKLRITALLSEDLHDYFYYFALQKYRYSSDMYYRTHTHTHTVTFSLAQTELFQTIFRSRVNTVTFGLSEIQ